MVVPQFWGVARYVIFVGAAVLFCFEIANVSPTETPAGIPSTQTFHGRQENSKEKASVLENSKVRRIFLFVVS